MVKIDIREIFYLFKYILLYCSKVKQKVISLLIGRIDNDRQYSDNGTYGHSAGDKVLIKADGIRKKNENKNDVVCLWGGEEFPYHIFNEIMEKLLMLLKNKKGDRDIELKDSTRSFMQAKNWGGTGKPVTESYNKF